MIHSHLEYGSAVFATAAVTHLKKLDVIQRIAARIIFRLPRDVHSGPLLEELQLEDLGKRRSRRIVEIVASSLCNECHPVFQNMFQQMSDGYLEIGTKSKRSAGDKRLSVMGAKLYNEYMVMKSPGIAQ